MSPAEEPFDAEANDDWLKDQEKEFLSADIKNIFNKLKVERPDLYELSKKGGIAIDTKTGEVMTMDEYRLRQLEDNNPALRGKIILDPPEDAEETN